MKFIDLHTHTFFSDGVLSPAELIYRYKIRGCEAVALTDHVDYSNAEIILEAMKGAAPKFRDYYGIEVIVGVELTYIPPLDILNMVERVRGLGAELVVVHGETSAEEVPLGTNLAAVKASCDILAHPGILTDEVASIAKENNVCIEITTRKGHGNTNKEVSEVALRNNSKMVLNTDSHVPDDLLDELKIKKIFEQCGLTNFNYDDLFRNNSQKIVERVIERRK